MANFTEPMPVNIPLTASLHDLNALALDLLNAAMRHHEKAHAPDATPDDRDYHNARYAVAMNAQNALHKLLTELEREA